MPDDDAPLSMRQAAVILRKHPNAVRELVKLGEGEGGLAGWLERTAADGRRFYCTTRAAIRDYHARRAAAFVPQPKQPTATPAAPTTKATTSTFGAALRSWSAGS